MQDEQPNKESCGQQNVDDPHDERYAIQPCYQERVIFL
jgi:hypothetical protein